MNRAGQRLFAIGLSMLLAGCATFEHQTTEMEPHAVITVVKPWEVAVGERVVKSLDGLPVSGGKSYRVRPGGHAVVVEFTELISATAKPKTVVLLGKAVSEPTADVRMSDGAPTSVTGQLPFQSMQMANVTREARRLRSLTNSITVQAGGSYRLSGDEFTSQR